MSSSNLLNTGYQGGIAGDVAEGQVILERIAIENTRQMRVLKDCLQFGAEVNLPAMQAVVKRLDSGPVAG